MRPFSVGLPAVPPRYTNPGFENNWVETNFMCGAEGPAVIRDHALEFIRRYWGRPFFLYSAMM